MIVISRPYIERDETAGKLNCKISLNGDETTLWYSVGAKYVDYLTDEKADAFLVSILPYAMASGENILVKDVPISENILWSLKNEYIPTLSRCTGMYREIEIEAEPTQVKFNASAVGTGFSGGWIHSTPY